VCIEPQVFSKNLHKALRGHYELLPADGDLMRWNGIGIEKALKIKTTLQSGAILSDAGNVVRRISSASGSVAFESARKGWFIHLV
jgi:hypothetical protein